MTLMICCTYELSKVKCTETYMNCAWLGLRTGTSLGTSSKMGSRMMGTSMRKAGGVSKFQPPRPGFGSPLVEFSDEERPISSTMRGQSQARSRSQMGKADTRGKADVKVEEPGGMLNRCTCVEMSPVDLGLLDHPKCLQSLIELWFCNKGSYIC